MFFFVLLFIAVISILMAVWSLRKQSKLGEKEIADAKKALRRHRIIYHKDSSTDSDKS